MIGLAALRSAVGVETIDELDAAVIEHAVSFGKLLDRHDAALDKLTTAEQADHALERLVEDANARLCEGLKVPEIAPEVEASHFAAMARYSALCASRRKFTVILFTPIQK